MGRFKQIFNKGLYRSRDAVFLGVCRGIAEYFDFSVSHVRIVTVIIMLLSGLWPITGLYFIAAFFMKPEPVIPIQTDEEQEFYDSYLYSKKGAAHRLKQKYKNLERRIQRMEHIVTEKDFDWDYKMGR